ncbi:MAG TPA: LacI family DNA-binding transcriptional regulator [Kaistia sp.]|nr:LacI family DNA-binding transcriptional regulator [Kaistia sp.]
MVKITEVAKRAGVSLTTVSHVINHRDRVSAALRERVEQAIADLGYIPNRQAQSLRTGRTNVIALMIPDICNPFYTQLVRAIQTSSDLTGVDTLIYNTDVPGGHSEDHGKHYLQQIKRRGVDGLIVADAALHRIQHELRDVAVPTVFIGNLPSRVVDSIEQDGFKSAYRMGQYLISKGHRRIAHVTGPSFFNMSMLRQNGFERALADAGLPMDDRLRFEGSFLPPSGREAARWLVETHRDDLPSAVFFASSRMACAGLSAFTDLGIRVPEDIAVACYDVHEEMIDVRPRLTTIGVDPADLGRGAIELLNERIGGSYQGPPRQVVLPATLEIHQTA